MGWNCVDPPHASWISKHDKFDLLIKFLLFLDREEMLQYLNDEKKIGTRLLFAGNLTRQPYMQGAEYRISGELKNTDNVMNNTFWIGVQPALTKEMLEYAANKIETYLVIVFK